MVGTHKAAFVLAGVLGLATVLLGGGGATRIASSASPAASPPRSYSRPLKCASGREAHCPTVAPPMRRSAS